MINPRLVHQVGDEKIILLDTWSFQGDKYEITTCIIHDLGEDNLVTKAIRGGMYYCVTIPKLKELFIQAGFSEVQVLQDRYFQPVLIATKP